MCSLKSGIFLLRRTCTSLDTDRYLYLHFETAWPSILNNKCQIHSLYCLVQGVCFAAKTLVCHFTGFQGDTPWWLQKNTIRVFSVL